MAWASSSAKWSATPEISVCTRAPPSSSALTSSPGGGLHQGRAAQEDGAGAVDDDGLVAHGRDVGAAGGAAAHDRGDLGDARRRRASAWL